MRRTGTGERRTISASFPRQSSLQTLIQSVKGKQVSQKELTKVVFGLSALITTCNAILPFWLPECLAEFASLADKSNSDYLKVRSLKLSVVL